MQNLSEVCVEKCLDDNTPALWCMSVSSDLFLSCLSCTVLENSVAAL